MTISLPDAGYWLFKRGVAVPPDDPFWGRCENCNDREDPCWSCEMRVAAENLIRGLRQELVDIRQVTDPSGWGKPDTDAIHAMADRALRGE